jgi:RES domain-containing protein
MPLGEHLIPWTGEAYRHIPASSPFNVLDFRFAGRSAENRWNEPGQPTLYLAGDEGVLIAEWGRHFAVNRTPELERNAVQRAVFRLSLTLDHLLDLRQEAVWRDLSLSGAPSCFLDQSIARATATFIRATTDAQAILVPSVCFLDKLDRWCLALFLEKLPDPRDWIHDVQPAESLRHGD